MFLSTWILLFARKYQPISIFVIFNQNQIKLNFTIKSLSRGSHPHLNMSHSFSNLPFKHKIVVSPWKSWTGYYGKSQIFFLQFTIFTFLWGQCGSNDMDMWESSNAHQILRISISSRCKVHENKDTRTTSTLFWCLYFYLPSRNRT